MIGIIAGCIFLAIIVLLIPSICLWYKRNRCPKCGEWHCLKYVTEVVTDRAVGHDRNRFGGGRSGSYMSDQPFIRYWVEERYVCQKCGSHVSVHMHKDKR